MLLFLRFALYDIMEFTLWLGDVYVHIILDEDSSAGY